ncbi:MAG: radical SAM protein [Candidatus Aenigmatarchaeota archaeon]
MQKGSAHTGSLPEGCRRCAEGGKMVLLVTGKCEGACWYCPLSEKKKGKAVVYADEKKVSGDKEVIEEARSIDATGTGITGGDPLCEEDYTLDKEGDPDFVISQVERTVMYIQMLKSEFGKDHHIHLYTRTTDIDAVRRAYDAGLDEIRFHPDAKKWHRIEETEYPLLLKEIKEEVDISLGIEIPSIPEKEEETIHLLKESGEFVDFVNINELEFSSTNTEQLKKRGYEHKSDVSSAVKGSEEMALRLLKKDFSTPLHYCSLAFKDGVQLTNRIKRRAKNVSKKEDLITEEGTIIRGMIESEEGKKVAQELRGIFGISEELLWYDEEKDRIECSLTLLREIHESLEEKCFGVEIYPTADGLEVERWPLDR